jgi:hypothetical protein
MAPESSVRGGENISPVRPVFIHPQILRFSVVPEYSEDFLCEKPTSLKILVVTSTPRPQLPYVLKHKIENIKLSILFLLHAGILCTSLHARRHFQHGAM